MAPLLSAVAGGMKAPLGGPAVRARGLAKRLAGVDAGVLLQSGKPLPLGVTLITDTPKGEYRMALSPETISAFRFGYGFKPDHLAPAGVQDLLNEAEYGFAASPDIGGPPLEKRLARITKINRLRRKKEGKDAGKELKKAVKKLREQKDLDMAARISAPVFSENGFFERLAWFWTDHFTVAGKNRYIKAMLPRYEADAIRPHIATSFEGMLQSAETHPAMLRYLDQFRSVGPGSRDGLKKSKGLNENLAREIIELHTLGAGAGYSQKDIRQFAELLTGLTYRPKTGEQYFRSAAAEPGSETVLGNTYGENAPLIDDIRQAFYDLARHPATARHLARKLAVYFVSDAPTASLTAHIENAFLKNEGRLMPVYEALLEHPDSWRDLGDKVRQPFEYVVSSMRAAGISQSTSGPFLMSKGSLSAEKALSRLNQPLYGAPGPDGWPQNPEAWISPPGLTARIDWAARLGRHIESRTDPRDFLLTALRDNASAETRFAATHADGKWEGIALVLASPEFNRR
jgi:uncharacterized protein (DUF1800 family)